MTPLTPAGQALLDGFAPSPLPDAQELHRRSAQGRRDKLLVGILAIERQAADRALAELRREVEDPERFGWTGPPVYAIAYAAAVRDFLALIDKASKPEEEA